MPSNISAIAVKSSESWSLRIFGVICQRNILEWSNFYFLPLINLFSCNLTKVPDMDSELASESSEGRGGGSSKSHPACQLEPIWKVRFVVFVERYNASLSIDAQDHILCSEQPSLVQPLCDRELDETKAAASGPDWTALDRGKENLSAKQARLDCLTSPGKERISRWTKVSSKTIQSFFSSPHLSIRTEQSTQRKSIFGLRCGIGIGLFWFLYYMAQKVHIYVRSFSFCHFVPFWLFKYAV